MGNWSFEILFHFNSVIFRPRASLYLNPKSVDYWTKVFDFFLHLNLDNKSLNR